LIRSAKPSLETLYPMTKTHIILPFPVRWTKTLLKDWPICYGSPLTIMPFYAR
jgi:hypothetical protein